VGFESSREEGVESETAGARPWSPSLVIAHFEARKQTSAQSSDFVRILLYRKQLSIRSSLSPFIYLFMPLFFPSGKISGRTHQNPWRPGGVKSAKIEAF